MASFCEHGNEPLGSIKQAGYFSKSWVTNDFPKNLLHHGVSYFGTVQVRITTKYLHTQRLSIFIPGLNTQIHNMLTTFKLVALLVATTRPVGSASRLYPFAHRNELGFQSYMWFSWIFWVSSRYFNWCFMIILSFMKPLTSVNDI
jgi:hypothetical protein